MMRPLVGQVVGRTSNQLQRFCIAIAGGGRKEGTHFRTQILAELMGSQVEGWGFHNQHRRGSRSWEGKSQGSNREAGTIQECNLGEKMTPDTQEVPGFLVRNLEVE